MRGWCCPVGAALLLRCCGSVMERLRCCGSAVSPCLGFAIVDHRGAAAGFGRGEAQREGVGCGSGGFQSLAGVARADTSARLPLPVLCHGVLGLLANRFRVASGVSRLGPARWWMSSLSYAGSWSVCCWQLGSGGVGLLGLRDSSEVDLVLGVSCVFGLAFGPVSPSVTFIILLGSDTRFLKMALKLPAGEAAKVAFSSIGRGYDISLDLRLKYCKGDSRLIEIDEDQGLEVVLPTGVSVPHVSKSIKCDKGERTRFRSDILTFQQMSEQFNQELSLTGKIPSGFFNAMFEFSGCWRKDAAYTRTLAFDGVFITLYTVALEKSQMVLKDHVKKEVPSTWEPAALARFISKFGTHVIVGMKMGGKDVIYMKQQHSSSLQPADVQKKLKSMADKRFMDANAQNELDSEQIYQSQKFEMKESRLRFADNGTLSSYSHKDVSLLTFMVAMSLDIVSICKRRGGSDGGSLTHSEWLQTVLLEPDVISMSFIPITSLLNGVPGSGYLSHAINLYLRFSSHSRCNPILRDVDKPPIEELHQFLEFQLPRQWAPVFSDLPLGPQQRQQSSASLQFSLMGPRLFVNTTLVDAGKRPVTGMRLYLEGKRGNRLAIHLQHLSSLPSIFQLADCRCPPAHPHDRKYFEKVQWKSFSHVCTAPVESEEDLSIVTGAQLQVGEHGFRNVLFLRLRFSTVAGAVAVRYPEWDGSPGLTRKSGLISTLISTHFTSPQNQKKQPLPADVNVNSAVYPGGPPAPAQASKLLRFVDVTEMMRGPQEAPGYWVVSGARLVVERGKISIRVKYSLLTVVQPDDDVVE
ncbi:MAC/Perforin domain-containing protein [Striga asiatica]|uniref:MAC/Perforin domain-containing protein n=1 Tax=Striga asiatica TaxID=4170 RepID=A0A5A7QPZ7_STRAF|nr:MAC/Perforin domain-containing protein [Striga asiatica]